MEEIVLEEEHHSRDHIQAHGRDSVVLEMLEHDPGQLVFGMHVRSHWPAVGSVEFQRH